MKKIKSKTAMVVQISDLPEEVLIEIFKKIDSKTVKEAALVCSA